MALTTQSMFSYWYSAAEELIAFVGNEVLMLAFAAFVYLACTGNLPNQRAPLKTQRISKHSEQYKAQDGPTMQDVSRALREGDASKAVEYLTSHLEANNYTIPVQVGSKILVLLSQPNQFASMSVQAARLAGRFNQGSLESASVEVQRNGDVSACKQLLKLADVLRIPKSSLVFESIVFLGKQAKAIRTCGKEGNLQDAITLFEVLKQPNTEVYNSLLDVCIQCNDMPGALKYFNDAQAKSLANVVSYNIVIKGHLARGNSTAAQLVLCEMRAKQILRNTSTYNTMLNAFAECGDMHKVSKLLEDMKTADPPVEPDIVTYSTMLKGFCAAGDLDRGIKVLNDMQEDGKLGPSEMMFNSLLDGYARQYRLDDALKLLDDMKQSGVSPSNYTLSIMIKLLGRGRRLNQAFSMVKSVCQEHGFRANVQVYTCLIQACFHNRQTAKALALHDQVVQEGCVFDQKAYIALARGCLMAGAVDQAADVIRCAHHIHGHGLQQCHGRAPGVDARCLEDVLARLSSESAHCLRDDVGKAGGPSWEYRPYSRKHEFRGRH